jgi:parallel beta-helix repeat protein
MMNGNRLTLVLAALLFGGSLGAGLVLPRITRAAVTSIPISACGNLTQEGGFYVVQNALSTASGDCLVISASDVTLNLNGKNITSTSNPKSGAGIHVKRKDGDGDNVTGVFIEGGFFPGGVNPMIRGFAAGIENEADGTVGDDVNVFGNIDGLLIKGAKGSNFSDFNAGGTGADANVNGVHILGGEQNTIGTFSSAENNTNSGVWIERSDRNIISTNGKFNSNGNYGVWVDLSSGNTVSASSVSSNGSYGVWVDSSSGNQSYGFFADSNGTAGVYIGCNPAFSGTASKCSPKDPSNSNLVFDIEVGKSQYGIVVDLGNQHNQITDNTANTNTVTDALDENSNCDKNNWFAGNYGTKNPVSCIN